MTVPSGFEEVVGPLRLRRPTAGDLGAYTLLHTDPRTYRHAPERMPDALQCRIRLDDDLEHWGEHGFGYLAVEEVSTGRVIGWAGVRHFPGVLTLNLYYRLGHDAHGLGYGRLLARAVTVSATEVLPDQVVRASIRTVNVASTRTALAAGLVRIGVDPRLDEPPGTPASDLYQLPRVARVDEVDDELREDLLRIWLRVNEAGGPVGFLLGATPDDVSSVLDEHLAQGRAGRSVLGMLRDPDDGLLGFAWWQLDEDPRYRHIATLLRLQVDPGHRGRNLGRLLLAGMHALARSLPGIELLRLDYRSGHGLGDFYARAGWVETGRQPGGLRGAAGDDRDDVSMLRRVDGGQLVGDGCT